MIGHEHAVQYLESSAGKTEILIEVLDGAGLLPSGRIQGMFQLFLALMLAETTIR